jgi:cytochrome c oxidase accessory protein FixG
MSLKKAKATQSHGGKAGDCVDCTYCVEVCPTGVDIRQGPNLGCIQCGLCIDACDNVMAKLGRQTRLIAFDTDLNIKARLEGKKPFYRLIRTRTVLYAAIIAVVGGLMLFQLATRDSEGISVIHDRNPMYVRLSDGALRNAYTIRIVNKQLKYRDFILGVDGLPSTLVDYIGLPPRADGRQLITVGPDQTREVRVIVTDYSPTPPPPSSSILFSLIDIDSGQVAEMRDHFFGP